MISVNKISLVIFDMDGLMFDTEKLAIYAWKKAGESLGVEISDSTLIECIGLNIHGAEKIFKKDLGISFPFRDARKLRIEHADEFIDQYGVPVKRGLYQLLEFLEQKRVRKAVATSTERERAEKLLSSVGIKEKFEAIICGDDVLMGKPEPGIFLAVAKKLGCNPRECLVLEDSENGIIAASKANMKAVLIPDVKIPSKEVERLAFKKFDSLADVLEFMETLDF